MWPLELSATPEASPRFMSGGSLSRLGTESNGISGGCCCANADGLNSMRAPTSHIFMGSSLVFCLRCPTLEHFSQKWNSVGARKCDRAGDAEWRAAGASSRREPRALSQKCTKRRPWRTIGAPIGCGTAAARHRRWCGGEDGYAQDGGGGGPPDAGGGAGARRCGGGFLQGQGGHPGGGVRV